MLFVTCRLQDLRTSKKRRASKNEGGTNGRKKSNFSRPVNILKGEIRHKARFSQDRVEHRARMGQQGRNKWHGTPGNLSSSVRDLPRTSRNSRWCVGRLAPGRTRTPGNAQGNM